MVKNSEILNQIRELMGEENLINSCSGYGCQVYLTDVPPERVIVDVDKVYEARGRSDKHCDRYVLYYKPNDDILIVAIIELKSGDFKANDVIQQLQGSADFISDLIPKEYKIACIPILFHGKGIHKVQNTDLRRVEVHFRGKMVPIRRRRCGEPKNFANVLDQANLLT